MKISAVVISFNEEKNIERCLKSLRPVADEIVVVDSGSKDKTEAICRRYGVRFYKRAWKGYSSAKNYGNQKAVHDFIFSIDADEALSVDLQKSLREFKTSSPADAYRITIKTWYCGRWIEHSGWYPDTKVRFWNKKFGKWAGAIHEKVKLREGSRISALKGDLLNYGYYTVEEHLTQINLFTTLMAKNIVSQGGKTSLWKIITRPVDLFFTMYVLRLGFLDGYQGFLIAAISSFGEMIKHVKIREFSKT